MRTYAIQILLVILSLISSRLFFLSIHDTEGPNLLIVTIAAIVIYLFLLFVSKKIKKVAPKAEDRVR